MATRIVLADDEELMRNGMASFLSSMEGLMVVGQAESGREVVELAEKHRPDVVLMDVKMPEMNGIEATQRIREKLPETHVIALSGYSTSTTIRDMLKAGATAYLSKSCRIDELREAIETVKLGKPYFDDEIREVIAKDFVANGEPALSAGTRDLSGREREVVSLMAQGKPTKEIASDLGISIDTVATHRRRICSKLGITGGSRELAYHSARLRRRQG